MHLNNLNAPVLNVLRREKASLLPGIEPRFIRRPGRRPSTLLRYQVRDNTENLNHVAQHWVDAMQISAVFERS